MNLEMRRSDVVVVGGGPGGIAAALWCRELGLSVALIEKGAELGGQLLRIFNPIENYPGLRTVNGAELARLFTASLDNQLPVVLKGVAVSSINFADRILSLSNGEAISAGAIVLATGVRRRRLGVPGEAEFLGRGVLESGVGQRNECKSKRVVIVGGGDAAVENAVILGKVASAVTVVHRRGDFSARPEFIDEARSLKNVEFVMNATVDAIDGDSTVRGVRISENGRTREIEADAVLIRIGVEPNSSVTAGALDVDAAGYITVDRECRTSLKSIYAIGDIASPTSPTICTAVGMGATAAKSAFNLLKGGKSL